MDRRKKYLKLLAFVPAIVLVGGFIGCRAGVFDAFSKPEPKPDPHPTGVQPQPLVPQLPEEKSTFMPGSKSINLTGPTIGLVPAGTNAPDLDVPIRQQPWQPAGQPPNPPPGNKPPVVIGGSKSAPIFNPGSNAPQP
jgi:hypothetical protein